MKKAVNDKYPFVKQAQPFIKFKAQKILPIDLNSNIMKVLFPRKELEQRIKSDEDEIQANVVEQPKLNTLESPTDFQNQSDFVEVDDVLLIRDPKDLAAVLNKEIRDNEIDDGKLVQSSTEPISIAEEKDKNSEKLNDTTTPEVVQDISTSPKVEVDQSVGANLSDETAQTLPDEFDQTVGLTFKNAVAHPANFEQIVGTSIGNTRHPIFHGLFDKQVVMIQDDEKTRNEPTKNDEMSTHGTITQPSITDINIDVTSQLPQIESDIAKINATSLIEKEANEALGIAVTKSNPTETVLEIENSTDSARTERNLGAASEDADQIFTTTLTVNEKADATESSTIVSAPNSNIQSVDITIPSTETQSVISATQIPVEEPISQDQSTLQPITTEVNNESSTTPQSSSNKPAFLAIFPIKEDLHPLLSRIILGGTGVKRPLLQAQRLLNPLLKMPMFNQKKNTKREAKPLRDPIEKDIFVTPSPRDDFKPKPMSLIERYHAATSAERIEKISKVLGHIMHGVVSNRIFNRQIT